MRTPILLRLSFFIVILCAVISCRKAEMQRSLSSVNRNARLVEKFLNLPTHASPELAALVNDLRRAENHKPFLLQQIAMNGMPEWASTIANRPVIVQGKLSAHSTKADSERANIFFVPFLDTVTHEVKSFLYCVRIGDSAFRYKMYNKGKILAETPYSENAINNGKVILNVFAALENTINHKTTMSFGVPYSILFDQASIMFDQRICASQVEVNAVKTSFSGNKKVNDDCWVFKTQTVNFSPSWVQTPTAYQWAWYENICTGEMLLIGIFPIGGSGGGSGGSGGSGSNDPGSNNPPSGGGSGGISSGGWWYSTGTPPPPGYDPNAGSGGGSGGTGGAYNGDPQDPFGDPGNVNSPVFWPATPDIDPDLVDDAQIENYDDSYISGETDNIQITFDYQNDPFPNIPSVLLRSQFVGWVTGGNCLSLAKQQIAKKSLSDLGVGSVFQAFKQGVVDPAQTKAGMNYIISKLKLGHPVIVGVDNKSGAPAGNSDGTTDHFVTIVGAGSDSEGNYFLFYDNASVSFISGTSDYNRLYFKPATGKITGTTASPYGSHSGRYPYSITQIRQNR